MLSILILYYLFSLLFSQFPVHPNGRRGRRLAASCSLHASHTSRRKLSSTARLSKSSTPVAIVSNSALPSDRSGASVSFSAAYLQPNPDWFSTALRLRWRPTQMRHPWRELTHRTSVWFRAASSAEIPVRALASSAAIARGCGIEPRSCKNPNPGWRQRVLRSGGSLRSRKTPRRTGPHLASAGGGPRDVDRLEVQRQGAIECLELVDRPARARVAQSGAIERRYATQAQDHAF